MDQLTLHSTSPGDLMPPPPSASLPCIKLPQMHKKRIEDKKEIDKKYILAAIWGGGALTFTKKVILFN